MLGLAMLFRVARVLALAAGDFGPAKDGKQEEA